MNKHGIGAGAPARRRGDRRRRNLLRAIGLVSFGVLLSVLGNGLAMPVVSSASLGLALTGLVLVGRTAMAERAAHRPLRVAVIGDESTTDALAAELARAEEGGYVIAGRIDASSWRAPDRWWLGSLPELRRVVEEEYIDLLLLSSDVSRITVFDELSSSCQDIPVRLCELSAFYEETFGYVPIGEINSAWFQCILHPNYRIAPSRAKRLLDLALCLVSGLLFLPVMLVAALIIRRDGGPVFYTQTRIGEGGRPFAIVKLRTMRMSAPGAAPWCAPDDDRITPIGRILRKTHLDEVPQLWNVVRGEMSIVGPRPEQPHYVAHLERTLPYYSRRHQLRPGVTGWAQIRCGYAGSEQGTAWKLSYDLYYLRHRRLLLDLRIAVETGWNAWRTPQFAELGRAPVFTRDTLNAQPSQFALATSSEPAQATSAPS